MAAVDLAMVAQLGADERDLEDIALLCGTGGGREECDHHPGAEARDVQAAPAHDPEGP